MHISPTLSVSDNDQIKLTAWTSLSVVLCILSLSSFFFFLYYELSLQRLYQITLEKHLFIESTSRRLRMTSLIHLTFCSDPAFPFRLTSLLSMLMPLFPFSLTFYSTVLSKKTPSFFNCSLLNFILSYLFFLQSIPGLSLCENYDRVIVRRDYTRVRHKEAGWVN